MGSELDVTPLSDGERAELHASAASRHGIAKLAPDPSAGNADADLVPG